MTRPGRIAIALLAGAALVAGGCSRGGAEDGPDPLAPPASRAVELVQMAMELSAAAQACTTAAAGGAQVDTCWYHRGDALVCIESAQAGADGGRIERTDWYRAGSPFAVRTVHRPRKGGGRDAVMAETFFTPEGAVAWAGIRSGGHWRALAPEERARLGPDALEPARRQLADDLARPR